MQCQAPNCKKPAKSARLLWRVERRRYCHTHAVLYQHNGHPTKRSYSASTVNPYRRAVHAWLSFHRDKQWVRYTIAKVEKLYANAGKVINNYGLRGVPAKQRAVNFWARLRDRKIDPHVSIAAYLGVLLLVQQCDPLASMEWRRVQAAKLLHRIRGISSNRRRYVLHGCERKVDGGRWIKEPDRMILERKDYPSRGRVLRWVGRQIEDACRLLVEHHIEDIRQFKARRDARGVKATDRPWKYLNGKITYQKQLERMKRKRDRARGRDRRERVRLVQGNYPILFEGEGTY